MPPKDSWSKIGTITCIDCITAGLCVGMLRAVSGYGGFVMYMVFLIGAWLIGLISGFALTKSRRQYWFTVLTTTIAVLLFGASALKCFKQELRQSISTAFSAVVLDMNTPSAQLEAQQSADKQAHFLEYLLDHY